MGFAAARENMVDSQIRTNDVTDPRLQAAMRAAPRERFCAGGESELAYAEREPQIADGRRLMTPRDVAKLLMAAAPRPGERALVVCEPYAAAVLARVGLDVVAAETAAAAAVVSDALFDEGVELVRVEPEQAVSVATGDWDLLVVGGAVAQVPADWLDSLREGGRAVLVLKDGAVGRAHVYLRNEHGVSGRAVFECAPAYLPGMGPRPAFVF